MFENLSKFIKENPLLCASIVFVVILLIMITLFMINVSILGDTYRSGVWTSAYTENITSTYGAVSFLAAESGSLCVFAFGAAPTAVLSLGFYLWHLNRKISKLQKQLTDYSHSGE